MMRIRCISRFPKSSAVPKSWRGLSAVVGALLVMALPAQAQTFACVGVDPAWQLEIGDGSAQFAYLDRDTALDIPQSSKAEGREWPRAYTLIGRGDTAIVLLHQRACEGGSHEVQVLTQRGETPILLTGCCQPL